MFKFFHIIAVKLFYFSDANAQFYCLTRNTFCGTRYLSHCHVICSLAAAYKEGRCKQGAIIFHGDRVVVSFVPKFVAIATEVGRGEI